MGETWNESRELPRCPGKKNAFFSLFASLFINMFYRSLCNLPSLPFHSLSYASKWPYQHTLPSFFYFTSPSCTSTPTPTSTSTSNTNTSPLLFYLKPFATYLLLTLFTYLCITHCSLQRTEGRMTEVDLIKKRLLPNSVRIPLIKAIIEAAVSHRTARHGVLSCWVVLCMWCSTVLENKINCIDSLLCLFHPPRPCLCPRPPVLQLPSWSSTVFTSPSLSAYPFISSFILLLRLSLYLHERVCTYWLYVQRKESIRNQAEAAWQLTKNEKKYVSIAILPYYCCFYFLYRFRIILRIFFNVDLFLCFQGFKPHLFFSPFSSHSKAEFSEADVALFLRSDESTMLKTLQEKLLVNEKPSAAFTHNPKAKKRVPFILYR